MRKLLLLAGAAAIALSMPAAAKEHGSGKTAHSQPGKDRTATHGRSGAQARAGHDSPKTQAHGSAHGRTADKGTAGKGHVAAHPAKAKVRVAHDDGQAPHQRHSARDRAREQGHASLDRARSKDHRQEQKRLAARERAGDHRPAKLDRQVGRDRDQERRFAARERRKDQGKADRRLAVRDEYESRVALQRTLASRDVWQDRERYYAEQARRYRLASYDRDDYDYRYLYRNVQPAYFYSASDFLPIGRSAPPAWAPAWGRRSSVPYRYQDVYYDTPYDYYRYDDGYIYRVDSRSNLIADVIPLLGGGFAVGQLMPIGYDAYNVPDPYRDYYYDTDDAYYRYGDGGIYQVDPGTGMIEAIVALLAGDLNIGQPLPTGYDAYNLPFQYRDQYVDNDDYIYRYNDGNIYQADAQSGLIENVISAVI